MNASQRPAAHSKVPDRPAKTKAQLVVEDVPKMVFCSRFYRAAGALLHEADFAAISAIAAGGGKLPESKPLPNLLRMPSHYEEAGWQVSGTGRLVPPHASKGERHAGSKPFALRCPRGNIYTGRNLTHFVRSHPELFAAEDVRWRARRDRRVELCPAIKGLQLVMSGVKNAWKDWTLALTNP